MAAFQGYTTYYIQRTLTQTLGSESQTRGAQGELPVTNSSEL